MNLELLFDVLRNSILITGLVLIMMLMIEYFNIQSRGEWFAKLKGSGIRQIVLGSALGLIPGCIGGFAAVSLFTHRMISFGALIAMMICSSGDEAFVILAMIPQEGIIMFAILFAIAVITGIVVDKFIFKRPNVALCSDNYEIHSGEDNAIPSPFRLSSYSAMKAPSKKRVAILLGIALFIGAVLAGFLEHDHNHIHAGSPATETHCMEDAGHNYSHNNEHLHIHSSECNHIHSDECNHIHSIGNNILNERWINVLFALFSIITLLFTASAKEHFIEEHIWNHVIKKHLLSIFLWTFGALLICQIAIQYMDIQQWISDNMLLVLLLAVAIGIIPESGPHLIFVTLFAESVIPFYILLVNSIVQDGHTTLPLLAESKGAFFKAKLINMAVGLLVGIACWLFVNS